jgi:hypothetical protein
MFAFIAFAYAIDGFGTPCGWLLAMAKLYLQPQLQSNLLEYFRSVAREENENIQFIIVTSSSALIDKANAEELFMLMPSE